MRATTITPRYPPYSPTAVRSDHKESDRVYALTSTYTYTFTYTFTYTSPKF